MLFYQQIRVMILFCFTDGLLLIQMQVFNWFLQDKKDEPIIKFTPKIVINNKSTLYVQVEPKDPTTTSNIIITAFTSQQLRSIVPIRVEWSRFKIKTESSHATEKIHCLAGNTYMCQPGDVGGYIKAVVKSVDESIRAEAEVVIGPIGIDVMVKRVIDGSLYAGNLLSQVVICERERKNNVTVRLYSRTIQFVDDVTQQKLVKEYSISQPKIQLNPKDPTRVYFRFEHDQNSSVRQWLNKIFNLQNHPSLEQSSLSIRIPYTNRSSNSSKMRLFQKSHGPCPNKFEMRFISRLSRDLFLFTQRAFVCRQDMKNSIYIQRIQSLQNLATEQDYYKFLQFMSLKMQICRIADYAKEVEEDRDSKVKDLITMEESIGEMTLTYLKIIEQKGKRERIDFQQSYSQINNTREQYLNRKNVRQLKSQNENLKQRLREMNEEIDLLKFFKKEDNQSMIFNQTSNPFAKKNNQTPFHHSPDKSAIKGMHQLSINYANLLEENRILKSQNRNFKTQMMNKNHNKILDHSQNMIELLGSLDEREEREVREAKFTEYQQSINNLKRQNEQLKRKLNDITQGQSKIRGLGVTKQSRYYPQEQPSFINNQSLINQTVNQSMNSNASSFMNNSITSEAAMAKLQDNLANLSKINAKLQQDNSRVRKERDYYRNEFNKMKQYIKQFENGNANTYLQDSRMHSSEVAKYKQYSEQLQNEKNALVRKLQSISKENSQGLKEEYLLREKKIKDLEQIVERLTQQNRNLSKNSQNGNKAEKLQTVTNENNKLKKINSQLLEQIKNLKVQLQQIKDEENMYNSRVIELQNQLNFVKMNNSLTYNNNEPNMLEKINQLSKQNAKLKQQSEQKTIKLQNQSVTIDKLMREHNQMHSQTKHVSSSLSSTNSKQKCYSQKCNQSTIQQLQKYKREVKKLQEQIIFMKKSSDAINRSRDLTLQMDGYYEEKIQIMRKQMDALYLQNENLSKMCERYGKDAREANKELNKCRQKIMNLMRSKHQDSSLLIQ